MKKLVQFKVTVAGSGGSTTDDIDFIEEVNGVKPVVRSIICLNDLSSLIGKIKMSLTHNGLNVPIMKACDVYGISKAFVEKFKIDFVSGRYDYTVENSDSSSIDLYFQVELEYII